MSSLKSKSKEVVARAGLLLQLLFLKELSLLKLVAKGSKSPSSRFSTAQKVQVVARAFLLQTLWNLPNLTTWRRGMLIHIDTKWKNADSKRRNWYQTLPNSGKIKLNGLKEHLGGITLKKKCKNYLMNNSKATENNIKPLTSRKWADGAPKPLKKLWTKAQYLSN